MQHVLNRNAWTVSGYAANVSARAFLVSHTVRNVFRARIGCGVAPMTGMSVAAIPRQLAVRARGVETSTVCEDTDAVSFLFQIRIIFAAGNSICAGLQHLVLMPLFVRPFCFCGRRDHGHM